MAKLDVPAVEVLAEHNAPARMRDGTILRADVYRRAAGGPFPVLLIRNPYGEPMVRTAPVRPALDAGGKGRLNPRNDSGSGALSHDSGGHSGVA